ncbi:heavy metal translocating P-type ATPase [Mammaliicoccus sp. Dog046]|uniref:heavy metal translocating P-type ATPase n=1 Tax=Mammaliicoccus sp. Dog046 TaxID=3034233 RepID=UPI002B25A8CF|nr:heavy metal translocating P-type ATPase [Mammaliicoccus sp. Dog046]WQK85859.1 heavy metal translocating P-type ATPase [Mammaliicoccus sp. Dog046]
MSQSKKMSVGVTGMTCAACSNRIEKVLNRMDGVDAQVNLSTEKASVTFDEDKNNIDDITNKIEKLGYGVLSESVDLDVYGMTCAACSNRIEKVLNRQDGIKMATVNLTTEQAHIEYNPESIDIKTMIDKIKKLGYDAQSKKKMEEKYSHQHKEITHMKRKLIISAILSVPLLLTMFVHLFNLNVPHILMNSWFQLTLATPVQFIIGWQFYVGAYKNLRNKSANMDVLVALGTSAAYFYSVYETIKSVINPDYVPHLYFETSAVLITLILFGKYLEKRAKSQTTNALSSLMNLQAKEARVLRNGKEEMISINDVIVGDVLIVKPGEKIPTDGTIEKGKAAIDESMITGESIPVEKSVDADVIGSTIIKNGNIYIKVTKIGSDTALASIVKAVEEAQGSKAPIQRLADIISGYFVPIVVGLALLTFIIWITLVNPGQFERALVASIAVLVIACPCALGLATPTSIMVGTGKAAEQGILFKGGEHLERTHQLNTIVLDKTGTITKGKPEVTDFTADKATLQLLASAEKGSEHPLAEAIVAYAVEQSVSLLEVDDFHAIAGKGIQATIDQNQMLVGNRNLMTSNDIEIHEYEQQLSQFELAGKTAMLIAVNNEFKGIIAVADTIKESAPEAIRLLKNQGLNIVMLTGDNERTAQAIAKQIGIDHVIAEVLPEEKANTIKELQKDGKKVAMVGDGINDAPALAIADIGIAIGTGTEVAIEAADVTILGGELLLLPKAIKISHATIKNIKQNLFWAFGYNTAGIPIAALGLLAPWIAGAAMALSSVSVITNALRLKKVKL